MAAAVGCLEELATGEVSRTRKTCINQPCIAFQITLSRFKAGPASCQGILPNQPSSVIQHLIKLGFDDRDYLLQVGVVRVSS